MLEFVCRNPQWTFSDDKAEMMIAQIILVVLCAVGLAIALGIVTMSRRQKAATGELELMGARAAVETPLEPEGSVLIRGELWRARARTSARVERGRIVRVVGASGYLLEVEPIGN